MKRREALKDIGIGGLSIFAGSVLFSSLQSCSPGDTVDWEPVFFTKREAAYMEKICEAILPKTNISGATEAGVVQHLDSSVYIMDSPREKEFLKEGLRVFVQQFDQNMNVSFEEASIQQVTSGINGYLRGMKSNPNLLKNYSADLKNDEEKQVGFYEIHFVYTVVNASIWSYMTSELVGETVMVYDPVPGAYDGCMLYEQGRMSMSYL